MILGSILPTLKVDIDDIDTNPLVNTDVDTEILNHDFQVKVLIVLLFMTFVQVPFYHNTEIELIGGP